MVNAKDIFKQQLLDFLKEKYFKCQQKSYINLSNYTLSNLIQHLYDDHGTIYIM